MKLRAIRLLVLAGVLLFGLNSLQADGPDWASDILIYEGEISCFDVDYKVVDGAMYVGFQKDVPPDYPVCFCTSTDNGLTWQPQLEIPSPGGRWPKMRVLVGEPLENWLFCFFVSEHDDHPYVWRMANDFSGTADLFQIDTLLSDREGFDVARSVVDAYSMVFAYYSLSTSMVEALRSIDFGANWEAVLGLWQPSWASKDVSIAWGPPSHYYLAGSRPAVQGDPIDSTEIVISASYTDGLGWQVLTQNVTQNVRKDYDPHVAASHDLNNPAIWVAETCTHPGNDLDLTVYSVLSPDSIDKDWAPTYVGISLEDEYWGDIKFYKSFGNHYVDMAWTYEEVGADREVHWSYSSGLEPTSWSGDIVINDHLPHSWPYGAAPKIVYSPPAGPGGGVVYAGTDSENIYFDAPWLTGVEESASSGVRSFSIYPNLLTTKTPLNLSLPRKGLVEVSVYDVCGRLAYDLGPVRWNEGTHSLHLDQVTSGVYFLKAKLDGQIVGKAKLTMLK